LLACWFLIGGQAGSGVSAQEPPPPPLPSIPTLPDAAPLAEAPVKQPVSTPADGPALAPAVFQPGEGPGDLGEIEQVVQEVPFRLKGRPEDTYDITASTELPGPERLFRRQSEREFFERIREDYRAQGTGARIIFPQVPPLTTETFQRRDFAPRVRGVEPNYVCHGRLLFEQPNFERQGWDLGILTPICNMGIFYYDLALLPYHAWTRPVQMTDCSAGKCLPGDRTPLYLYHEEFSVSGLAAQAAVVTGLFYLFP
jgi:hypothetical protein